MEYLKKLNLWVKLAIGVTSLCAGLYAGWAWAGDRILWADDAADIYATKDDLQGTNGRLGMLSRILPIEVELRLKRSEVDQLRTIIMYGHEHQLDTELDELKKTQLLEKILTLEMALQRIELESPLP